MAFEGEGRGGENEILPEGPATTDEVLEKWQNVIKKGAFPIFFSSMVDHQQKRLHYRRRLMKNFLSKKMWENASCYSTTGTLFSMEMCASGYQNGMDTQVAWVLKWCGCHPNDVGTT